MQIRIDKTLEQPLVDLAKINRRHPTHEANSAIESHIDKNKAKLKKGRKP